MINWHEVDTVLLDLDGTLLDLHFDNYFWCEHLPACYAQQHDLALDEAHSYLMKELDRHRGKLRWYLTDFWSEKLTLDIIELKRQVAHKIKIRPSVMPFLGFLAKENKQRIIATNADHNSLKLKFGHTGIDAHVNAVYSSEGFGKPKEERGYWQDLEAETGFDPKRTLLIDDNLSVLNCAKDFGIQHLLAINKPDSQQAAKQITEHKHVEYFDGLHSSID